MLLLPGNTPDARGVAQEHERESRETVATACTVKHNQTAAESERRYRQALT